jgi:hypothetical protein
MALYELEPSNFRMRIRNVTALANIMFVTTLLYVLYTYPVMANNGPKHVVEIQRIYSI